MGDTATPDTPAIATSSFATRIGARIVDVAILLALNVLINGWFIYQYVKESYPTVTEAIRESDTSIELTPRAERLSLIILLVALLLWAAYEVPALVDKGQTPGKRLLGIRAIDPSTGDSPRLGSAIRRWLVLAIPLTLSPSWPFPSGSLLAFLDGVIDQHTDACTIYLHRHSLFAWIPQP